MSSRLVSAALCVVWLPIRVSRCINKSHLAWHLTGSAGSTRLALAQQCKYTVLQQLLLPILCAVLQMSAETANETGSRNYWGHSAGFLLLLMRGIMVGKWHYEGRGVCAESLLCKGQCISPVEILEHIQDTYVSFEPL
jgi:hypothetical protein